MWCFEKYSTYILNHVNVRIWAILNISTYCVSIVYWLQHVRDNASHFDCFLCILQILWDNMCTKNAHTVQYTYTTNRICFKLSNAESVHLWTTNDWLRGKGAMSLWLPWGPVVILPSAGLCFLQSVACFILHPHIPPTGSPTIHTHMGVCVCMWWSVWVGGGRADILLNNVCATKKFVRGAHCSYYWNNNNASMKYVRILYVCMWWVVVCKWGVSQCVRLQCNAQRMSHLPMIPVCDPDRDSLRSLGAKWCSFLKSDHTPSTHTVTQKWRVWFQNTTNSFY